MAATTALKIIKKAMQKCGILTKHQNPTADEAMDALDALNDMIASWANDSLTVFARTWEDFPLTPGIGTYTMGLGGDFNTVRPIDIITGYTILGGIRQPVTVVNDENFINSISLDTTPGQPYWINYSNEYPLAKVRTYPVAPQGYRLFLLTEKQLNEFTNLNSVVDLPPGWNRALIYNLPAEIAGDYGQEVPADVQKIASQSKSMLQKSILKNHNLDSYPTTTAPNNIYTGYNR